MIKINNRLKTQELDEEFIKYICIYRDKSGNHEEPVSLETLDKFRDENDNYIEACKKMYDTFNRTLRPGESKRILIGLYQVFKIRKAFKVNINNNTVYGR